MNNRLYDYSRTPLTLQYHDSVTGGYKPLLHMPVLQIVGARSAFIDDTANINAQLDASKRDWLKVVSQQWLRLRFEHAFQVSDACGLVLDDKPEAVSEALLLFLQGLGYCKSPGVEKLT